MKLADLHNARVKLLWIEGAGAEEFADLIGAEGKLTKSSTHALNFMPAARGDWLTMSKARVTAAGESLRVRSALGNTYVFRRLDKPAAT